MVIKRFDVYLVDLSHAVGSEIKKNRPCLIISPEELNRWLKTVITAPMTTKGRLYPTRIPCSFQGKEGQIVLDQIRTIDKSRLIRKLGSISRETRTKVLATLAELFAE